MRLFALLAVAATTPIAGCASAASVRPTQAELARPSRTSVEIPLTGVGADQVVDAISAEDIGKFPDSNLAAAIQRVPGVSISRGASALGGVPTSTGDATQITVRGFGPSAAIPILRISR